MTQQLTTASSDKNLSNPVLKAKHVKGLRCRECAKEYAAEPIYVCAFCFGPLEVIYDYEYIKKNISRQSIEALERNIWRYRMLLPVGDGDLVNLGAGYTPLIKADNLAKVLGLKTLYIKNDTLNPTGSFKDRVVAIAVSQAKQFGFKTVSCASTGNLANATAAAAAKGGLDCYIFIPHDLEKGKVLGTLIYGPKLIKVRGNYDAVNRLCSEVAQKYPWAFVNVNVRPYYAEGSKTLAFETAEQLGWKTPDHVVVPIASGSLLTKIDKGFKEFYKVGLLDNEPKVRVSGAQAVGCNPVFTAWNNNAEFITPIKPNTIAKSLAIGNPADGFYAKEVIKNTNGACAQVTDEEIVEGIKLLAATEGIFAETAGGVTIASLKKLVESGVIKKDEVTVAYVTGHGMKTLEAIEPTLKDAHEIDANMKAFEAVL